MTVDLTEMQLRVEHDSLAPVAGRLELTQDGASAPRGEYGKAAEDDPVKAMQESMDKEAQK